MSKFKTYAQGQPSLLPPRLDEFVGDKDLVRVVSQVVGDLNISELLSRFPGTGAPAYHPEMMLKVLVFAYGSRVYSSRRIAQLLKRDVQFMWLSGKQQPDFRTINRFRGEYLKGSMESVFAGVVQLLLEQGHVKGEDYFLDGTKVEADANRHKLVWKKNVNRYKDGAIEKVREILKEVDRVNAEEDERYGDKDLPEYGEESNITPEDIARTVKRINEKLKELNTPKKAHRSLKKSSKELAKLQGKIERYEEQKETLGERNSYSPTDPDATGMHMKDDTMKPAYNVQAGNEQGFVIGYSVHQNGNDGKTLISHLDNRDALSLPAPERIVADAAYGTEENYKGIRARKIENFLKYPSFSADVTGQHAQFAKENFVYDKAADVYRCPGDRNLVFIGEIKESRAGLYPAVLRQYQARSCKGCRFISKCCPESRHRTVSHSVKLNAFRKQARDNILSESGTSLHKRRGNECESLFGDLKHNQGYRRCRLRGRAKVTTEFGLLFTSFNIRKLCLALQANT